MNVADGNDARLKLTPTQQRLYEALIERRADLGEWYRAAIAVINDPGVADRLSLAAHALREVMEKLPGDDIQPDRAASLPEKVRALQTPWTTAREEDQRVGGAWNGEITEALRTFLTAMQAFFDGQAELANTRQAAAQQFIGGLHGAAGLPTDIHVQNAKLWMKYKGYFISVAHHKNANEDDFLERVAGFESFLADRLRPRPTDDFATIDALLEED